MKTKRFRKWCAIFIPTLVIIFFFAGFLFAPNDPMKSNLLERYADPSAEYPFGTDALGRCILSRILYGGWTTLGIVLGGSLIVFLLGTVIGMVTSRAVMKENALIDGLINAVTAIPPIAYLIVFIGAWGSGAKTTLVALTVSYILRYIREEMISGDCTRFVRNENYWGEAPYYDEVVIKYIPEASSRLQALQTGEVDLIYGADLLSYDDYNQALSLDGIEGAINDGNTLTRNLVLNASSEILSDLKVRQAIAYAVNKEEITKGLTYGYETPATSLFAPGAPYTDITYNSTWSYDLDKANALLDEAGWVMNESTGIREKDGQQLSLNYTYWTDLSLAQDMALAIKTQLAEVGIDVTTTGQDQMTWWTEGVAGNYDITTWNTEGSYTEPHKFLQESLGADPHAISLQALDDFQSYSDAVDAFSTSADPEVVQDAIATALNVSNDNVIDLPISYSKDMVVYNSSKIAGYTFSSVPQFFEIDNVQPAE